MARAHFDIYAVTPVITVDSDDHVTVSLDHGNIRFILNRDESRALAGEIFRALNESNDVNAIANSRLLAERGALRDALDMVVGFAETYMSYDPDSRFGIAIARANLLLTPSEPAQ